MREARRAGSQPATAPIAVRMTMAAASVTGSRGCRPYNRVDTNCVAQRVGSVSWVRSERFQRWLRAMNSRRYSVFVSVNTITSGRRSRTRDAIGAVRHVFLDADEDGSRVLSCVDARRDLPPLSYVLHTSPNHVHLFWRVIGFDHDSVERLQ